jgi:hypothetical protein
MDSVSQSAIDKHGLTEFFCGDRVYGYEFIQWQRIDAEQLNIRPSEYDDNGLF